MVDMIAPILRDHLTWLGDEGRPYEEVIEAWRTSCPRLPIWEEANNLKLIARVRADHDYVVVTPEGHAYRAEAN